MPLSGIFGHDSGGLSSRWGSTIKSQWVHTITGQSRSWYDHICCKDVRIQPTIFRPTFIAKQGQQKESATTRLDSLDVCEKQWLGVTWRMCRGLCGSRIRIPFSQTGLRVSLVQTTNTAAVHNFVKCSLMQESHWSVPNLTTDGHTNNDVLKFGSDNSAGITPVVFLLHRQQLWNRWLPKETPKDPAIPLCPSGFNYGTVWQRLNGYTCRA